MTFAVNDPTKVRGSVRLLIGDTDPEVQEDLRLEDEDVDALITLFTTLTPTAAVTSSNRHSIYTAAVHAGSALRAKFLRKAEGAAGPDRMQPKSRAEELAALVSKYQAMAKAVPAAAYIGGLSVSERDTLKQNTDRIGSFASLGMMDNKG